MLHRAVTDEGPGGELEGAVQELKMVILEDSGGHHDGCGAMPAHPCLAPAAEHAAELPPRAHLHLQLCDCRLLGLMVNMQRFTVGGCVQGDNHRGGCSNSHPARPNDNALWLE